MGIHLKTRKNNHTKFSAMRRNCPSARLRIYLVSYVKFSNVQNLFIAPYVIKRNIFKKLPWKIG
jgi:hypothetical protein